MSDPLIRRLADLPLATPDPARAERLQQRCRATLSRSTRHATAAPWIAPRRVIAMLVPPVIAGLGVAYLTAVMLVVLAIYGVW